MWLRGVKPHIEGRKAGAHPDKIGTHFNYMINEVIEARQSYMTIKWVMILKQMRMLIWYWVSMGWDLIFYFVGFMGFDR